MSKERLEKKMALLILKIKSKIKKKYIRKLFFVGLASLSVYENC